MSLPEVILVVTIDVEEDNWGLHRSGITVENVQELTRLQHLFDRYGIRPTFLVSYHVVLSNWAIEHLSEILTMGKCEIGAHLHPWNTPPVKESLNPRNSMLLNLPYELQLAKLKTLTNRIKEAFSLSPNSFRAGRWALGSNTIKALINSGYRIDTTVTPTISWRETGNGPIYMDSRTDPYQLPDTNNNAEKSPARILEVPATVGFNRWPLKFWNKVYTQCDNSLLRLFHPTGFLNRLGLLRKIWLSPEISSSTDMIDLSKTIVSNRGRVLNLSFHSNSLLPQKGPFVRDEKALERFYARLEKIIEYLRSNTNLQPMTLSELEKYF